MTNKQEDGEFFVQLLDCDPQIGIKENSTDRRRGKRAQAKSSFQVRQSFNNYINVE